MNWKRTARWSWLILPFLLLAVWPGAAAADPMVPPGSNAVLYEVTESLKVKGLRSASTAALMGTVDVGTAICPFSLGSPCTITAIATRSINLATATGPVTGTFSVVVELPGGASNPVDAPEFEVLRGDLLGTIDLSPALRGGVPLGTIEGTWSAKGVKGGPFAGVQAHGTFAGTFRLPFDLRGRPLYLTPGFQKDVVPVDRLEHSLGEPTVRLEVNFVAE